MGQKFGALLPFWGGERGPHLTQGRLGCEVYLHTKWHLDPCSHLATTDMGLKLGICPFGGGGAGSPSNTTWPEPRPTCMPSFILIHPTIWPQYSNVTDRQTNKTDKQRSDIIGQTVLGRLFVKWFALYYRTVVCPVGLSRPKPHCVRWGPSSPQ